MHLGYAFTISRWDTATMLLNLSGLKATLSLDLRHCSIIFVIEWHPNSKMNLLLYLTPCRGAMQWEWGEQLSRESLKLPVFPYLLTPGARVCPSPFIFSHLTYLLILPVAPFKGFHNTPKFPGTLVENHCPPKMSQQCVYASGDKSSSL